MLRVPPLKNVVPSHYYSNMKTKGELDRLRDEAISLHRAGKSRREIKEILGISHNDVLTDLLCGEPPQEWTKRPNAKDDLRDQARKLRLQGLKYSDIASQLRVSKSSVSLWVRDLPTPPQYTREEAKKRAAEGARQYWVKEREIRECERASFIAAAAAEIGNLTDRELLIAGAIAYWCEGAKKKPYVSGERVIFVNSDPGLIRFFLRFLSVEGIPRSDLVFCVQIHESADVSAAERYWQEIVGAGPDRFTKTMLKRHNPQTNRKNAGETYHGCLRICVHRSSELYRKIEGWASAIMFAV